MNKLHHCCCVCIHSLDFPAGDPSREFSSKAFHRRFEMHAINFLLRNFHALLRWDFLLFSSSCQVLAHSFPAAGSCSSQWPEWPMKLCSHHRLLLQSPTTTVPRDFETYSMNVSVFVRSLPLINLCGVMWHVVNVWSYWTSLVNINKVIWHYLRISTELWDIPCDYFRNYMTSFVRRAEVLSLFSQNHHQASPTPQKNNNHQWQHEWSLVVAVAVVMVLVAGTTTIISFWMW